MSFVYKHRAVVFFAWKPFSYQSGELQWWSMVDSSAPKPSCSFTTFRNMYSRFLSFQIHPYSRYCYSAIVFAFVLIHFLCMKFSTHLILFTALDISEIVFLVFWNRLSIFHIRSALLLLEHKSPQFLNFSDTSFKSFEFISIAYATALAC